MLCAVNRRSIIDLNWASRQRATIAVKHDDLNLAIAAAAAVGSGAVTILRKGERRAPLRAVRYFRLGRRRTAGPERAPRPPFDAPPPGSPPLNPFTKRAFRSSVFFGAVSFGSLASESQRERGERRGSLGEVKCFPWGFVAANHSGVVCWHCAC